MRPKLASTIILSAASWVVVLTDPAADKDPITIISTLIVAFVTIYYVLGKKSSSIKPVSPTRKHGKRQIKDTVRAGLVKPEVLTICDGKIHVAIGYGLANAIVLEGEEGCVLIDTMESNETAKVVLKALKCVIKEKPIEAIVLTHFHPDHTLGLDVFLAEYPGARIFAHETLFSCFQGMFNVSIKITANRGAYQFGTRLSEKDRERAGIGVKLNYDDNTNMAMNTEPTDVFKDKLEVKLAGFDLVLYHAPGETNDQIVVHWPERDVLFPADNIYGAFPNLYAVRGVPARDTLTWAKAIDLMRRLKPSLMVPQHTSPIEGREKIMEILTSYRDAIQLVHDQTVRYMNKGLHPDDITRMVHLPPYLADHPYLQEFYGTVEWSVKGVYCNYIGWFNGQASALHPMATIDHSLAMVDLAGGPQIMCEKMNKAFSDGNLQWTLELADHLIITKNCVSVAKDIKCKALRLLAEEEVSACGRNWYLTEASVEEGLVIKPSDKQKKLRVYSGKLYDLFLLLTCMVDFDKAVDVVETACFHFTDVDQHFILKMRRGVLELLASMEDEEDTQFDLVVTTTDTVWRQIMAKDKSAAIAIMKRELEVKPSALKLQSFMSYFDTM